MRDRTVSAWVEMRLVMSLSDVSLAPGRVSPFPTFLSAMPGTTSATIPPTMPADFSSTFESAGTSYSPSISSRMATSSWLILKR